MQTHTHTLSSGMNHISSLKQSFHSFCKLQNSSIVTYLYPCKTLGPAILYGSILRVLFWILKKYHVYIFNLTRTNAHWKRHCLRLYSGNKELYLIQSLTHNNVQLHGLPKAIQSQQKSVTFTLNCTLAVPSYPAPEWTLMFFELIYPHSDPEKAQNWSFHCITVTAGSRGIHFTRLLKTTAVQNPCEALLLVECPIEVKLKHLSLTA